MTVLKKYTFPSHTGKSTVVLSRLVDGGYELNCTAKSVFGCHLSRASIDECGGIIGWLERQQMLSGITSSSVAGVYAFYVKAIESAKRVA